MKKILLAAAALCIAAPAMAQVNPAPTIAPAPTPDEMKLPRPARAHGIPTALAIEAAVEANRVCLGNTYKTTAMITDSAGVPIVMISNDGAAAITQRIAMTKVQAVLKYHMTSGEVAAISAAVTPFIVKYGSDHPAVYALALLPVYDAVARVKTHGHWQSDVLVGAAIGTGVGLWAAHRQSPLIIGWLPGGFQIGFIHHFK